MYVYDQEYIKKAYVAAEQARILLWELILAREEEFPGLVSELIHTEEGENYIKITVSDILPRKGIPRAEIRNHWFRTMHEALKNTNKTFKKVLCIIKTYHSHPHWDVDNLAFKYIIDSFKYNKVIKEDTFKSLSFMMMGEQSEDSRTEIYLIEHPEDILALFTCKI